MVSVHLDKQQGVIHLLLVLVVRKDLPQEQVHQVVEVAVERIDPATDAQTFEVLDNVCRIIVGGNVAWICNPVQQVRSFIYEDRLEHMECPRVDQRIYTFRGGNPQQRFQGPFRD
ncbi:hypothetical protein D3C73_1385730 [compost metagenome]